jgi:hypothetical protein
MYIIQDKTVKANKEEDKPSKKREGEGRDE